MISDGHHATEVGDGLVWRSLLSASGSDLRMVRGAFSSGPDTVVLDLEDAGASEEKAGTRLNVVQGFKELGRRKAAPCRINALDPSYFHRDLIETVEEAGESLEAPNVNQA